MGSDAHIVNYTVVGREVNLSSRLESFSGRGRILIGEATYRALKQYAPELANTCIEQPLASLRGFSSALRIYEVPWKIADPAPKEQVVVQSEPVKVQSS
jgi:class 3 adenylate cyclase